MRAAIGILSLLLALAIVGLLAKKQLTSVRSAVPVLQPGAGAPDAANTPAPSVRAQSQQVQQQYQQAVEGLMQPRAMPDADQ